MTVVQTESLHSRRFESRIGGRSAFKMLPSYRTYYWQLVRKRECMSQKRDAVDALISNLKPAPWGDCPSALSGTSHAQLNRSIGREFKASAVHNNDHEFMTLYMTLCLCNSPPKILIREPLPIFFVMKPSSVMNSSNS